MTSTCAQRVSLSILLACLFVSAKATAGFLNRARRSSLRFPDGFLDAVDGFWDALERLGRVIDMPP